MKKTLAALLGSLVISCNQRETLAIIERPIVQEVQTNTEQIYSIKDSLGNPVYIGPVNFTVYDHPDIEAGYAEIVQFEGHKFAYIQFGEPNITLDTAKWASKDTKIIDQYLYKEGIFIH